MTTLNTSKVLKHLVLSPSLDYFNQWYSRHSSFYKPLTYIQVNYYIPSLHSLDDIQSPDIILLLSKWQSNPRYQNLQPTLLTSLSTIGYNINHSLSLPWLECTILTQLLIEPSSK